MSGRMIFCDFDGTITNSDNIIAIMKKYAPKEWDDIKDKVLAQEISIKEGVGKMFALLPSSQREEITNFIVNHAEIRKGFKEFVAYTKQEQIPLYIVSGGIDFFVYPILEKYIEKKNIYCNVSDFSSKTISILWPHACDQHCDNDCGCCKPTIIRNLADSKTHKIVIGDSITDLEAAKLADQVIARDYLMEKCEEHSISFAPFETFYDVIEILKKKVVTV
ncbi:2-hydroxy-3-keto-5-methylthiopentenyl-1-phosphate phosphatase [Sutcliffiella rhizosphaerae]|uniref:2-hydroxy-3-keto-5-methylthiopentenyl-1-phosphate phosphatase n=1 Tax=Sutcliffiella rhizosphaerae TaxID=2880967 RepID=A0ABM8YKS9_9BACI|nr:2-hydroxy-3-keto-5-methylthiopentenyl-1-phosphate phosphatase [Sutcliffiella rhizosphaerae]CAG9620551.1 2-hydroxy-3-keto-5-methylthiopentenyl-1-phosphatephosphatase [Sutcliffiella rhizosphaerae]